MNNSAEVARIRTEIAARQAVVRRWRQYLDWPNKSETIRRYQERIAELERRLEELERAPQ